MSSDKNLNLEAQSNEERTAFPLLISANAVAVFAWGIKSDDGIPPTKKASRTWSKWLMHLTCLEAQVAAT
jgi:hypothetical protein